MGDPSEVTNCPEGSRPCVLELGLQHGPAAHGRPQNAATEHSHGRARGPPAWPGPPEAPLRASTAEVPAARSRHGGYDTVASTARVEPLQHVCAFKSFNYKCDFEAWPHSEDTLSLGIHHSIQLHVRVLVRARDSACVCL